MRPTVLLLLIALSISVAAESYLDQVDKSKIDLSENPIHEMIKNGTHDPTKDHFKHIDTNLNHIKL